MTQDEVLDLLKREQDPRGIVNWQQHAERSGGLKSYGIGLTRLRKIAKELGPDSRLAKQLWKSKVYEAKVLSLLIDDPKTMTIAQAEAQVEGLHGGTLAHVFSSCDATLAKTPFVRELLDRWVVSEDPLRRSCGYGLLYEVSKWKKKSAPDEAEFLAYIERIDGQRAEASVDLRMSMGCALLGIGKRSKRLHAAALRVAKRIGPVDFDPDGDCAPFDAAKNLTSPAVKKMLGL